MFRPPLHASEVSRRHPDQFPEETGKVGRILKTKPVGDLADRDGVIVQKSSGQGQPRILHPLPRASAGLRLHGAVKVAWSHIELGGIFRDFSERVRWIEYLAEIGRAEPG